MNYKQSRFIFNICLRDPLRDRAGCYIGQYFSSFSLLQVPQMR